MKGLALGYFFSIVKTGLNTDVENCKTLENRVYDTENRNSRILPNSSLLQIPELHSPFPADIDLV